jgi:hypothetical protein
MLFRRLRGTWPKPDHGPYFSLGRFGLLVNAFAVTYGAIVAVNIAWPRAAVYDSLAGTKDASGHVIASHWYWQYIAVVFIGLVVVIGSIYYVAVYRRKPIEVLAEHRAGAADPAGDFNLSQPALGDVAP